MRDKINDNQAWVNISAGQTAIDDHDSSDESWIDISETTKTDEDEIDNSGSSDQSRGEFNETIDEEKISLNIGNDNDLLNLNYYDYLKHLVKAIYSDSNSDLLKKEYIERLLDCCGKGKHFDLNIAYKNFYEAFFKDLLKDSQFLFSKDTPFSPFIDAIFANENRALKRTARLMDECKIDVLSPDKNTEKLIKKRLTGKGCTAKNNYTPSYQGSFFGRAEAMCFRYHPIYTTSLSSTRSYLYKKAEDPVELRFGTQGQYEFEFNEYLPYVIKNPGVNLLFKAWLFNRQKLSSPKTPFVGKIDYVYFNYLRLDKNKLQVGLIDNLLPFDQVAWESKLSFQLEALDDEYKNVAVITLPADGGLMSHKRLKRKGKTAIGEVRKEILKLVIGEDNKDFYISDKVKKLLYKEKSEDTVLEELLDASLKTLHFSGLKELTYAQKMAVYFHFIKFELTNYIINILKPAAFNMSCKDAIDRGGVSSAYYNLIKSIKAGACMTDKEFAEALHAAPIMVKDREMNDHKENIHNALFYYVHAFEGKLPDWLKKWTGVEDSYEVSYTLELVDDTVDDKAKTVIADINKPSVNKVDALEKPATIVSSVAAGNNSSIEVNVGRDEPLTPLQQQQTKKSTKEEINAELEAIKSIFKVSPILKSNFLDVKKLKPELSVQAVTINKAIQSKAEDFYKLLEILHKKVIADMENGYLSEEGGKVIADSTRELAHAVGIGKVTPAQLEAFDKAVKPYKKTTALEKVIGALIAVSLGLISLVAGAVIGTVCAGLGGMIAGAITGFGLGVTGGGSSWTSFWHQSHPSTKIKREAAKIDKMITKVNAPAA